MLGRLCAVRQRTLSRGVLAGVHPTRRRPQLQGTAESNLWFDDVPPVFPSRRPSARILESTTVEDRIRASSVDARRPHLRRATYLYHMEIAQHPITAMLGLRGLCIKVVPFVVRDQRN